MDPFIYIDIIQFTVISITALQTSNIKLFLDT